MTVAIKIKRLNNGGGLPIPGYATAGAAGMDVVAAESLTLKPGRRAAIPTGFAFAIPQGYEIQVRPRSGLALNHGITCLNTPGTIDSDYRGEVKIILANLGDEEFRIERGDRTGEVSLVGQHGAGPQFGEHRISAVAIVLDCLQRGQRLVMLAFLGERERLRELVAGRVGAAAVPVIVRDP